MSNGENDGDGLIVDAINAAEEIRDPLDGVLERAAADNVVILRPEILKELSGLKRKDPAAFESLRSKLKGIGCRVTALDEAIGKGGEAAGSRKPSQADILLELAQRADLFHDADGTAFADLDIDGHRETWPIRSKGFRRWLVQLFYRETKGAPNSESLQSALSVIEAKAHFDGPTRVVYLRVAGADDRLYLDLCDETWQAVEIDHEGWRVITNPPVRFRRARGMQPLPVPLRGGSVDRLRVFLNVESEAGFVLAVAWLIACLRDRGPYPVLVLTGEQGSAKSTFSAILRGLIDPNTAPLRALPREDRDLFIAASNSFVLVFDNVSGLPPWLSDTLCRLATGARFSVRELYTDQDEVLFKAARPVILNGIEDFVTRPDLADRAIFLTLEPIPEDRRRTEAELVGAFEKEHPLLLGALLDAVVEGLRRLPETHLPRLPRMADFALWATACESALWPQGTFFAAYCGNRDDIVDGVIDADPIAAAIRALMAERTNDWTGTASDLLEILGQKAGERAIKAKTWPGNARALAGQLRRTAPFLRKLGIEMVFGREGRARTRTIRISASPLSKVPESAAIEPSAPSAVLRDPRISNGFARRELRMVIRDTDGAAECVAPTVRTKPLILNGVPTADDADANSPTESSADKDATPNWTARV